MESVYQLFRNKSSVRQGSYFGIELEIEGVSPSDTEDAAFLQYARVIEDHSLRNGLEIVTNPLSRGEVQRFAKAYEAWAKDNPPTLTERCSTHIHVNAQDMNYEQLRSFLWLSIAVEGVLMEYCSDWRRNNTYCYLTHKVTNTVAWLRELLLRSQQQQMLLQFLQRGTPKYTAVGLFRFHDYGTVEFRMFDGTTSADSITAWCHMLESLRELAMEFTVEQLRDKKYRDGMLSILTSAILSHRGNLPDDRLTLILDKGLAMANDIVRKPLSREDILAVHAKLFPNLAPEQIIRGQFGAKLLALPPSDLVAYLSKFNRGDLEEAYSGTNALYTLFTEMSASPVRAAEIIVEIKRLYNI
jgi:hypothetical protein